VTWFELKDVRVFAGRNPLAIAFGISLLVHVGLFGTYRAGKRWGWWEHQSALVAMLNKVFTPRPRVRVRPPEAMQPQPKEIPLAFMEVDPVQAAPEPPKDPKYYGAHDMQAANPNPVIDTPKPKVDGAQEKIARVTDAPKPEPFPLQPAPKPEPKAEPKPEPKPETVAKPEDRPGDLAMAKPPENKPNEEKSDATMTSPAEPVKPKYRKLSEVPRTKGTIAGEKMKQDGGVTRRASLAMENVKGTPFGAYDQMFIQAVQQRWYDLIDSSQFVQRSGKVVLQFRLTYDGRISDLRVNESDVGDLLALLCQRAILDPAPYKPWPADMRRMIGANFRDVTFTFYYN
jgi:hypothetical protein